MGRVYSCAPRGLLRVYRLNPSVYMLRVEDRYTRFFEGLWEIPEGITYNSYVVLGEEHVAVIDTVKRGFEECYLEALGSITDLGSIGYIVVHHSEPDHSGALPALLRAASGATVYSHPVARRFVEATYGVRVERYVAVRDGVSLDLGGVRLEFVTTPWLHWPDTVMSLAEPLGILFTGDVFGAYGVPDKPVDSGYDGFDWYIPLARKYLATVVGTYRQWIPKALAKLEPLTGRVRVLAPLHGLVVSRYLERMLELYRAWGEGRVEEGKAVVVYVSMYGSAEEAALAAAEELEARGFNVHIYGFTDHERASIADLVGDAFDASIVVFAAATYEAGVMPLAAYIAEQLCKKALTPSHRVLILTTYGWGGAAGRMLRDKLSKCNPAKLTVVEAQGRIGRDAARKAVEQLLREDR